MKIAKITKQASIVRVCVDSTDREALTDKEVVDFAQAEAQKLGFSIAAYKGNPLILPVDAKTGELATEEAIMDPNFQRKCWRGEYDFAERFA